MSSQPFPTATLWRRLAAMVYDLLLLLALMLVTTSLFLAVTRGQAIIEAPGPVLFLYRLTLAAVWMGFYGFFWMRRAQTLGMAAWRMKLVRDDGAPLTWSDVLRRLAAGVFSLLPFGAGFLWALIDRDKLAWHDKISRTRPVVLAKGG